MSHDVETNHWAEVKAAVDIAEGMYWDGCHKIYLAMDDEQVKEMEEIGYDYFEPSFTLLKEWFEGSCMLRFVQAIRTNKSDPNEGFQSLIPQGFEERNRTTRRNMKFTMTVDMDNAAFDDPEELPRILEIVSVNVGSSEETMNLRDINGNTVGSYRIEGERDE